MPDRGWHHKPLGEELNATAVLGDPVGIGLSDRQVIAYRGTDGHLHEAHKPLDQEWVYYAPQPGPDSRLVAGRLAIGTDESGYNIYYRATDDGLYRTSLLTTIEASSTQSEGTLNELMLVGADSYFLQPTVIHGLPNTFIYRGAQGEIVRVSRSNADNIQTEEVISRFGSK